MSRLLAFSPFLVVALLIVGSTHYYIWARLVRDMGLPSPWHGLATALIVVLALSLPSTMALSRSGLASSVRPLIWVAFCWMGLFFITLCLLVSVDAVRFVTYLVLKLMPEALPMDPSRRMLLSRLVGGSVAALAGGAAAVAARSVVDGPEVTRVRVALKRLPRAHDGTTIVQISDLHVATLLGRDYVETVVARANALKPSIVAITGDLVDGAVSQLREAVEPLGRLQATHGVFFVTGNHEYYSGVEAWLTELRRLGVRVLRNERVAIGAAGETFDLAGIDDHTAERFGEGHGADLPKALAGRDPSHELVLLAHQPKAVFEAAKHGVGLMLSGHTHGGQIWPFGYLVKLAQPYLAGLATHENTQIYVNRGTGYWGPPMRLGVPPELTLLELRADV